MSSLAKLSSTWSRAWRVPATGFSFACFGIGGLLMGVLLFPLINLLVWEPARRIRWSRALVGASFRGFIGLMTLLGLVRVRWTGAERLQRHGLLVLANHPTLIDVVALIARTPNADCVVRGGLGNNPFTWGPVRACNYLRNDRGSEVLGGFNASLASGSNLVIFPEGTRSVPGHALQLQRGAAQLALRSGVAITPVRIRCEPLGLSKGWPWWKTHDRPLQLSLDVGEDIAVTPFLEGAHGEFPLAARRLTGYLQSYFSREKGDGTEPGT
ncbi:lysophospholipid acyltransferase family protein [Roseateles sp. NT4]|uniref:lysophospholipid acyltransferase family protein n=1 Tax=Roseateles sp. NT4 TaxID=3453715 RepID=UPI003EEE0697